MPGTRMNKKFGRAKLPEDDVPDECLDKE